MPVTNNGCRISFKTALHDRSMTIGFIVLSLLAALFVLLPLLLRGGDWRGAGSNASMSLGWYRQRLDELAGETADASVKEELEAELGQVLLADFEQGTETVAVNSKAPLQTWLLVLLVAAVPLLAWAVYSWNGDPGAARVMGAEAVLNMDPSQQRGEILGWQERLQARVSESPDDAKSLYLLGHAYLKLDGYTPAAQAFARAHTLNPEDISLKVYWLQSRFLAARGSLDEVSHKLAKEILEKIPNMPVVMEILALDAARSEQPALAITYLNQGLSAAQDARQQTGFVAAIEELRKRVQLPGVTVNVSAEATVPHQATLFVLARPVGGGMPLAVVRMPAVLLPQSVRLDDLVAMNPALKLSSVDQFEVVVRLSMSGQAIAQPGDWQWQSDALEPAENTVLDAVLAPPEPS